MAVECKVKQKVTFSVYFQLNKHGDLHKVNVDGHNILITHEYNDVINCESMMG